MKRRIALEIIGAIAAFICGNHIGYRQGVTVGSIQGITSMLTKYAASRGRYNSSM